MFADCTFHGIVIAANRTRHPLDARTLARLAGQYGDRGVVGFGLSNDERRGSTAEFAPAFEIAERSGLLLAPHGGELLGPAHIRTCLDALHANRLGHGIRAAEDLSLTLPRGKVTALVGPNGAGKTTLFRMIAGEETPDSGELRIGDTVELAYVDQARADLFLHMFGGEYATTDAERIFTDNSIDGVLISSQIF